jgi:hypothetical protein
MVIITERFIESKAGTSALTIDNGLPGGRWLIDNYKSISSATFIGDPGPPDAGYQCRKALLAGLSDL